MISSNRNFVIAGGLMSSDLIGVDQARHAAGYVATSRPPGRSASKSRRL